MGQYLKLMNEYTIEWPLWDRSGPCERGDPPVPADLECRLLDWAREFNDHFDWETGWDDPALREPHAQTGRQLYDELVAFLGENYDVDLNLWECDLT